MPIFGECHSKGAVAAVLIERLERAGCSVFENASEMPVDGDVDLWIGAVGPFPAKATDGGATGGRVSLRFLNELDERIVNHFASA
jgi:hypothetical protein